MTRVQKVAENEWLKLIGRFMQMLTPVVIALLLMVVHKLDDYSHRIDVLEGQVAQVYPDQYHGIDAKRDFEWRDRTVNGIEAHVENMDGRVQALELANARRRD